MAPAGVMAMRLSTITDGRSYAALNRIVSFDPVTRESVLEAGVTFAQLARHFHALKFTAPVCAATGAVTVGGAVANDIHSKNHHSMGGFAAT